MLTPFHHSKSSYLFCLYFAKKNKNTSVYVKLIMYFCNTIDKPERVLNIYSQQLFIWLFLSILK